jgi:hypothetical protein
MSRSSEEPARPDLTSLEAALASLVPRPARLDRDALFFRAGQRSAPRRWLWPCATAVSTLTAAVLGVLLALRPQPPVVERIVPVPTPEASPREAEPPEASDPWTPRRRLQEHLLRQELDGLGEFDPDPPSPGATPLLTHPLSSLGESRP